VLYDLHDRRGRARGEVPRLLQSCLRDKARWVLAGDQAAALRKGWQHCQPGERLILVIDEVDEALELVRALVGENDCVAPIALERAVAYE
jgi:hypothetical protein